MHYIIPSGSDVSDMAIMNLKAAISPVDSRENVELAIKELFPKVIIPKNENSERTFPIKIENEDIIINDIDYTYFLERMHVTKIADTALDCMSQNIVNEFTTFKISRQAALAGKIAFVLPNENPLGGCFELTLNSPNLIAWIEEVTWHKGRDEVPREVNDELKMRKDGVPQEWF